MTIKMAKITKWKIFITARRMLRGILTTLTISNRSSISIVRKIIEILIEILIEIKITKMEMTLLNMTSKELLTSKECFQQQQKGLKTTPTE